MRELETSRMPRILRVYLLGCIAVAFGYLALHTTEPLRLNVGDPWSDAAIVSSVEYVKQHGFTTPLISEAYRPTHAPFAEVIYAAMAKLGISGVGALRMIPLAFSMLWAWLVFVYARRIWGEAVALLATALLATSVLWMMYADSIDRPPVVLASCFLALWGVASAIETHQQRHYVAALAGSFVCLFGGFDEWVFLLAGVLFTVYIKRGNPFAAGNRRFVMICAAGALAAVLAKSVLVIGSVDWHPGAVEWQAAIDHKLVTSLATLLRRYTLLFTPMFWLTFGYTAWKVLRAPSVSALLDDGMTWLLAVALLVLYLASPDTASPLLRARPMLPFYAIGSAILITRLLDGRPVGRALGIAWAAAAPAWGMYVMLSHPRAVLDRQDVAKVRAYFAGGDRNDFVISNLLADGPIEAAFDRHSWAAPELESDIDGHAALLRMLDLFESTATDYVHAVIFTTPASRFTDRSLGQLVLHGRLASVSGWPYLTPGKANGLIHDYDKRVLKYLEAVGAKKVLQLSNFDVYRIDRASVLEVASRPIPVARTIDLSSFGASNHKLPGWSAPRVTEDEELGVVSIIGHAQCANPLRATHRAGEPEPNACETVLTKSGLSVIDEGYAERAQLMVRVERACDLRLTLELAPASKLAQLGLELTAATQLEHVARTIAFSTVLEMSINDFAVSQCVTTNRLSVVIPQRAVHAGVNIVTFEKRRVGPIDPGVDISSLVIEPLCEPR